MIDPAEHYTTALPIIDHWLMVQKANQSIKEPKKKKCDTNEQEKEVSEGEDNMNICKKCGREMAEGDGYIRCPHCNRVIRNRK